MPEPHLQPDFVDLKSRRIREMIRRRTGSANRRMYQGPHSLCSGRGLGSMGRFVLDSRCPHEEHAMESNDANDNRIRTSSNHDRLQALGANQILRTRVWLV